MRFIFRNDPSLNRLASMFQRAAGVSGFFSRFAKNILDEPLFPENEVFLLKSPKPKDIIKWRFQIKGDPILDEIMALLEMGVPEKISNFRLYANGNQPTEAFIANTYGEVSEIKSSNYFCPAASATLSKRCFNAGTSFVWLGTTKMIVPFCQFCMEGTPQKTDREVLLREATTRIKDAGKFPWPTSDELEYQTDNN